MNQSNLDALCCAERALLSHKDSFRQGCHVMQLVPFVSSYPPDTSIILLCFMIHSQSCTCHHIRVSLQAAAPDSAFGREDGLHFSAFY